MKIARRLDTNEVSVCTFSVILCTYLISAPWGVDTSGLEIVTRTWIPRSFSGTLDDAPTITFATGLTLNSKATHATMGQVAKTAYEHYFDWLANAKGGVLVGGVIHLVRLVLMDDNSSVSQSALITQRLIDWLNVDFFLGPYGSSLTGAAATVIHSQGKLQVASLASDPSVYEGRSQIFGTMGSSSNWLASTFNALVQAGAGRDTTVAFVVEPQKVLEAWCAHDLPEGWKEIYRAGIYQSADFKNVITALSSQKPDVVVACVYEQACHTLLEEAWSAGYSPKAFVLTVCVGAHGFVDAVDIAGDYVIGMSPWSPVLQHKSSITEFSTQSWVNAHRLEYLNDASTPGYHAASAFASCATLVHAIESANSTNLTDVSAALRRTNESTIYGKIRFNENGQSSSPMAVVQIQNGHSVWVNPHDIAEGQLVWPRPSVEDIQHMRCGRGINYDIEMRQCIPRNAMDFDDNSAGTIVIVIIIVVVSISGVGIIYKIRQRLKSVVEDRPDRPDTFSGSWVFAWIGGFVQKELSPASEGAVRQPQAHITFYGSRTRRPGRRTYCTCSTAEKISELFRSPNFIVNASPFDVTLTHRNEEIYLLAFSFEKVKDITRGPLKVAVSNSFDFQRFAHLTVHQLEDVLTFTLDKTAWEKATVFRGANPEKQMKLLSEHDDAVLRVALPDDEDARSGDVKLVWRKSKATRGHGEVLLITWSPPHIYRAMPVHEFLSFLDKVVEHKDKNPIFQRSSRGRTMFHQKTGQIASRNMYDVERRFLQDEATAFDAAYAEIRTCFGPADIFISHVWGETVDNTRRSLRKYCDLLADAWEGSSSADNLVGDFSAFRARERSHSFQSTQTAVLRRATRLWFCTCCNNQARVSEELGNDVANSPFAQVIHSQRCKKVLLISPMKALERKWCNYEFCQAVSEGKEPLMVTRDGVIQAGQVAPRYLKELSDRLSSFSCSTSTCSSREDEVLIDRAVLNMGGYEALDKRLKDIFHTAIIDAHAFTGQALRKMEKVQCSTSIQVEDYSSVSLLHQDHSGSAKYQIDDETSLVPLTTNFGRVTATVKCH